MDHFLEEYFKVFDSYKLAAARRDRRRDEIGEEIGWANEDKVLGHPDYKALDAEAFGLYQEADMLTPHVIRANLEAFGIQDMTVTGVLHYSEKDRALNGRFRKGEEAGRIEMLLSDLCGLRYSGLAEMFNAELEEVFIHIDVVQDGKVIGLIDSDGDFDYEAAPDLRTALGWKIATDGGRVCLIGSFDLDQATTWLLDTIRANGIEKEAFFGTYFATLKRVFIYRRTSRFADGRFGAATTLWHVATRALGKEHPGYPFCY